MNSAEFIAVSIWFSHFRRKSSIWSRGKWNLWRESALMTPSSTVCQLWSVSIIWGFIFILFYFFQNIFKACPWAFAAMAIHVIPCGFLIPPAPFSSDGFLFCTQFIWFEKKKLPSENIYLFPSKTRVKRVDPSVLSILSFQFPTVSCLV